MSISVPIASTLQSILAPACFTNKEGIILEVNNAFFENFLGEDEKGLRKQITEHIQTAKDLGTVEFNLGFNDLKKTAATVTELTDGYLILFLPTHFNYQNVQNYNYQDLLTHHFPAGSVTLMNRDLVILYTAGMVYEHYNLDPSDYFNKPLSELVQPKTIEFVNQHFDELIEGKVCYQETKFQNTHYSITFKPLMDKEGMLQHILMVANNTSQLHDYQARLFESKQHLAKYKQVLENSINEIFMFDAKTLRFNFLNKSAEENLGYSQDEWRKLTPIDIKPLFNYDEFFDVLEPLQSGKQDVAIFETVHLRKDGSTYDVEVHLQLFNESDPAIFFAIILDITDRNKVNKELREAKKHAEKASQAKSEFLATMSHEIRTPLNAIIGYSDLLIDSEMDKTQQNYMQTVQQSARSLMDLINDILDYSKIEAGRLTLLPEEMNLTSVIEQAISQVSFQAKQKQLELIIQDCKNIPECIYMDPVRFRQILVNLLSNAVKFTPSGKVIVSVKTLREPTPTNSKALLQFCVQDTGIGIKQENQERIFEAFSQEFDFTAKKYGGTGLGLNICNHLLSLMDSTLQLKSEVGEGSTFYFDLEVPICESLVSNAENIPLGWKKVLVIDDDQHSRQLIGSHLANSNIHYDLCENGLEATVKLQNESYDAVFTDYNMPYMTGLEVIRYIRERIDTDSQPKHVVLLNSTYEQDEISIQAKKLAVNGMLNKPFTQRRFNQLLQNLSKPVDIEKQKLKNLHAIDSALIVEDQEVNAVLVRTMLNSLLPGIKTDHALNGLEALKLLESNTYDIILMDIQMPDMNGYEATKAIRDKYNDQSVIIALTANVHQGEQKRCTDAGMDDYLSKPITKSSLQQKLTKWENTIANQKNEDTNNNLSGKAVETIHFDKKALVGKVEGDIEIVKSMIDICWLYLKDLPSEMHQAQNDPEKLHLLAHKLKGTCLNMGLTKLSEYAIRLMGVTDNRLLCKKIIQDIEDEISLIKNEFKKEA